MSWARCPRSQCLSWWWWPSTGSGAGCRTSCPPRPSPGRNPVLRRWASPCWRSCSVEATPCREAKAVIRKEPLIEPVTVSQSCAECLQSCDVSRELKNSQNSQNPKDLRCLCNIFQWVLGRELIKNQGHKEWKYPEKVNYVKEREHERKLEWMLTINEVR